jgi:hypothetical protein
MDAMSIDRIGSSGSISPDMGVQDVEAQRPPGPPPEQAVDGVDHGGSTLMFDAGDGMETRGGSQRAPHLDETPPPSNPPSDKDLNPGPAPILDEGDKGPAPSGDKNRPGVSEILDDPPPDGSNNDGKTKPTNPSDTPILE